MSLITFSDLAAVGPFFTGTFRPIDRLRDIDASLIALMFESPMDIDDETEENVQSAFFIGHLMDTHEYDPSDDYQGTACEYYVNMAVNDLLVNYGHKVDASEWLTEMFKDGDVHTFFEAVYACYED